jgi:MFS family permease
MMGWMRISATRLFIGVILAGQFMANIDTAIINVATPSIGATLHASGAELQLTVSVYVLATAMLLITAARLGTLYGYRRIFLIGLATFTLASLACGVAPNVLTLIVARIVQGFGSALLVAQVISGIQRTLAGHARTKAIGMYTLTLSLAAVVGQILGGVLITMNLFGLAWRPLFLINVPIGIVLFALALAFMPRDAKLDGPRPALDLPGVALLGASMLLLVLPLTVGREMQWPPWTIASLFSSVAGTAAFVLWQHRLGRLKRSPLLNLALFREPGVVPGLGTQMLGRVTYFTLLFVFALYVQNGLGESALVSGLSLVFWVLAYGIAGPVYPRLPQRIAILCGPLGAVITATAFGATALATALHAGTGWLLTLLLGGGGFGFGLLQTALTTQLTSAIPKERAPDLSGVLATTAPLCAVIGIATYGSVYIELAAPGGPEAATHAFAIVNALFAVTAALAAVTAWRAGLGSERVRALREHAQRLELLENVERDRNLGVA